MGLNKRVDEGRFGVFRVAQYLSRCGVDTFFGNETGTCDLTASIATNRTLLLPRQCCLLQVKKVSDENAVSTSFVTTSGSVTRNENYDAPTNDKRKRIYIPSDWQVMAVWNSHYNNIIFIPFPLVGSRIRYTHKKIPKTVKEAYFYCDDFSSFRKAWQYASLFNYQESYTYNGISNGCNLETGFNHIQDTNILKSIQYRKMFDGTNNENDMKKLQEDIKKLNNEEEIHKFAFNRGMSVEVRLEIDLNDALLIPTEEVKNTTSWITKDQKILAQSKESDKIWSKILAYG